MYQTIGLALLIFAIAYVAFDALVIEPRRARRDRAHAHTLAAAELRSRNAHPAGKGRTAVIPFPNPQERTRHMDRAGYDWTED